MTSHHPPTAAGNASPQRLSTYEVERIDRPTYRDFVHEFVRKRKPVILTGAMDEWAALTKWTPEFFRDAHGDKDVVVQGVTMKLGAYIDRVLASDDDNPAPYLNALYIRDQLPEVAPDILPDLPYTLPDRLRSRLMIRGHRKQDGIPELLIAGRGGKFHLHYDIHHMLGFVTQIYGDKEFTLFEPEQERFLYPKPDVPSASQIDDIYRPDWERFPLFKEARPIRFVLRAGEVLFNPAGWWHTTRMLTPSIAMVISTVQAANWRAFADDVTAVRTEGGLKPRIKRTYLGLAGALMSLSEWSTGHRV